MKQLKNQVTILTGTGSGIDKRKTLQFDSKGTKVVRVNSGKANGDSMVEEKRKPGREAFFIKAHPPKPEDYEAMVIQPAKPTIIDTVGTIILVGVILTIIILFVFFGNGINIPKPILR